MWVVMVEIKLFFNSFYARVRIVLAVLETFKFRDRLKANVKTVQTT